MSLASAEISSFIKLITWRIPGAKDGNMSVLTLSLGILLLRSRNTWRECVSFHIPQNYQGGKVPHTCPLPPSHNLVKKSKMDVSRIHVFHYRSWSVTNGKGTIPSLPLNRTNVSAMKMPQISICTSRNSCLTTIAQSISFLSRLPFFMISCMVGCMSSCAISTQLKTGMMMGFVAPL